MKSKTIALSSVSASLVAIALTVGAYVEMADLFSLAISSVFVLLPLYFNSYKGSLLAFLVGGVVALIISGFNFISLVFPSYFAFFGVFPIVKSFMDDKKVKKAVVFLIGLIWCVLAIYGMYFYYTLVMNGVMTGLPKWVSDYILYFIGVLAVVFYAVFYKFIGVLRFAINFYLRKIVK